MVTQAESGSFCQLTVTANSQQKRGFCRLYWLALSRNGVCIVSITRLWPGVHQPDPPGLIHDDPRLLPPLARVVLFVGPFRRFGALFRPVIHRPRDIHK